MRTSPSAPETTSPCSTCPFKKSPSPPFPSLPPLPPTSSSTSLLLQPNGCTGPLMPSPRLPTKSLSNQSIKKSLFHSNPSLLPTNNASYQFFSALSILFLLFLLQSLSFFGLKQKETKIKIGKRKMLLYVTKEKRGGQSSYERLP